MLYKFKSKAAGDVIMLQANGLRMLQIIGKAVGGDNAAKGILQVADMRAAVEALNAAIAQEEAAQLAAVKQAQLDSRPAPLFDVISLRQRAHPLIEMMRQCEKAKQDIVWGV
jgi:hypothetical protein